MDKIKEVETDSYLSHLSLDNLKKVTYSKLESSLKSLDTSEARTEPSSKKSKKKSSTSSKTNKSSNKISNKNKNFRFLTEAQCNTADTLFKAGNSLNLIRATLNVSERTVKRLQAQFDLYGKISSSQGFLSFSKQIEQREHEQ